MAILQITGRRGKAKKKHPKSSPIRAVQCPTKCHNFIEGNTVDSQLVREVKPGQFLAETRVATHCDVRPIYVFVLCIFPLDQKYFNSSTRFTDGGGTFSDRVIIISSKKFGLISLIFVTTV